MTGQQALQVLQKPVFGDDRCIDARDTLRIIEILKKETGKPRKALLKQDIDLRSYSYLLEDGSL
jgi:hypothetical protein